MIGDVTSQPSIASLRGLIEEAGRATESIYDELLTVEVRYLRGEPFEEGGMKTILRTRDANTGRPIAMAKLRSHESGQAVENFLREARITAHLEHPNIVPIYDIGLDADRTPYFTMKLLSGENLGRILAKLREGDIETHARFPLTERLDLFLKICDAVAYAHGSGVIHLDLKPENIQVSDYGEVLVCDWGLAKIVNSDCASERSILDDAPLYASCVNYLTIDGFFSGTPGYMAPEQAAGRKRAKTERTDIYSLGAILYSLLCFECPISGDSLEEVLENTRHGRYDPPRKRAPEPVPHSLEAVALKAMALDPADRYRSVDNMGHDIEAYRDGYATRAEDAGFWKQLKLLLARNPKVAWTLLAAATLLAVIVAFYTSALKQRERVARDNLAMYKTEREWRENYEAAPDYYYEAFGLYERGELDRAAQKVRIALDYDKRLFRAWELKALIHFARLEFGEAAEAFGRSETRNAKSWETISTKLDKLPKNGLGGYSPRTMRKVMEIVGRQRRFPQVRRMLLTYARTADLNDREKLDWVREIWDGDLGSSDLNSEAVWDDADETVTLDLTGTRGGVDLRLLEGLPVAGFRWHDGNLPAKDLVVLSRLPLRELDLAGCRGFSHVEDLAGMRLEKLWLRGTQVKSINGLRGMSLRLLDLSELPRVDAKWLQFIESQCQVDRLIVSERVSQFQLQIERVSQKTEIQFAP